MFLLEMFQIPQMFLLEMFQIPQMFLLEMFQIPQMFYVSIGMRKLSRKKYSFLMEKNDSRMQYYPLFLVIMIYKLLWK